MRVLALLALSLLLLPSLAYATPAPDSVAVVANADLPGSVALAMRYAEARHIPAAQVCLLSLPTTAEMSFEEFETQLRMPLDACLGDHRARIEALVLMRGVPIRVPTPSGTRVSVAAALGLWDTTFADGTPVIGSPPGHSVPCGGGAFCTGALHPNAYGGEPFRAGWTFDTSTLHYAPVLVTMLHGRTDEDAASLIDVALRAEAMGGAAGDFVLMRGADGARGVLDASYDGIAAALIERGVRAEVIDFSRDRTTDVLAGFVTGTDALGTTIEGNTYAPGALVDNLTSFGAVPENFEATGEVQVSIARWVASGAAGVHGTVDEPLNNCFPQRGLLVDYVDGATLAEAYLGRMPFVYWMNLVLGDPMLAPYAERPTVVIEGLGEGETFDARRLMVRADAPTGRTLASLILYVDGEEVARSDGAAIAYCLAPSAAGDVSILAVARTTYDVSAPHPYPGAASLALRATARGGASSCTLPDAGASDASVARDGGLAPAPSGCACRAIPAGGERLPFGALLLALLARRRVVDGRTGRRSRDP